MKGSVIRTCVGVSNHCLTLSEKGSRMVTSSSRGGREGGWVGGRRGKSSKLEHTHFADPN